MFPLEVLAPARMAEELADFCADARGRAEGLYGRLLRENIADVLRCSFPLTCARVGQEAVAHWADAFLTGHCADRPQFHHIATEFVDFAQSRLDLDAATLALVEYEWVLLAAEIDAAPVPAASQGALALNPTIRLVLLPFDLTRPDMTAGDTDGLKRPYAIYRAPDHEVVVRPLNRRDCLLIEYIRDADAIDLDLFIAALPAAFSAEETRDWIGHACTIGLLCRPAPLQQRD